MKTIAKISFLALGLAAVAAPAFSAATVNDTAAPAAKHPRLQAALKHRATLRAQVAKRLDLTADQKAQLKAKRAATAASLKALRADTTLTREQKKEKARELRLSARGDLKGSLKPAQKAKIQKLRERLKARRAAP